MTVDLDFVQESENLIMQRRNARLLNYLTLVTIDHLQLNGILGNRAEMMGCLSIKLGIHRMKVILFHAIKFWNVSIPRFEETDP